jgi:hypothetical protein
VVTPVRIHELPSARISEFGSLKAADAAMGPEKSEFVVKVL